MHRRCKTCQFWEKLSGDGGLCRISPPCIEGWPSTSAEDWCAAHAMKGETYAEGMEVLRATYDA